MAFCGLDTSHFDLYDMIFGGIYNISEWNPVMCFYQDFYFLKYEAASSIKFTKSLFTLATSSGLFKHSILSLFSQK